MDSSTPPENVILLRLPYELLLAVFRQLPDQKSIDALAEAYPSLTAVYINNIDSIQKAMRYNLMAEFVREATGHASLHLMRIALSLSALKAYCNRYSFKKPLIPLESAADYLSDSWVVSDEDLLKLKSSSIKGYLQIYCTLTRELTSYDFFLVVPNLDSWYNEKFVPVFEPKYLKRRSRIPRATHEAPANITDVEVLMVVDMWCLTSRHFRNTAPPVQTFLSMFTLEFSSRVVQFARYFMRGEKERKALPPTIIVLWTNILSSPI
ncbi:hypothetical protein E0Z10_g6481 [Xylaria hypoxylon]|uniref:Uncharacterized protein n=1 Tax=Xylaria hypoxylon TaxID=37992 RepID=A0A4Z0YDJ6_9PEZI|nr:hypothetical protein E0Z10_g6481 [Xylaria hypoxylon]